MSEGPRVVIIIPTKDRRQLLQRAVESVRSQAGDWRAIVIDDGSSDGTAEYLAALSASDTRFHVLTNTKNRGVNHARNRALATLSQGEWGFFLDDDDVLLSDAVERMIERIAGLPRHIEYVFFNSQIHTPHETYAGGYQFGDQSNAEYYDPSYAEVITKAGLRGDCKQAIAVSLIAKGYRFSEDVNGFESEFNALVARDGIGIRYYRDEVVLIDQRHGQARLSDTAARHDPASFVRVHTRQFRDHARFLAEYPREAMRRAVAAFKIAVRAHDPRSAALFCWYYLRGCVRQVFGKGKKDKEQRKSDIDRV